MLGRSKKRGSSSTTLISVGTEIKGDLCFSGHLEIEGTIIGNISAVAGEEAFVRVLKEGRVEGQINVSSVVINGTIVGDVYSSKHLELAENAQVSGDVNYNIIEMAKGAHVNGSLVFTDETASKKNLNAKVAPIDTTKAEANS